MMTSTWMRWLPAVTVPAVIAAGVLAGSLPASAGDPLPAKTPAQVLELIAQHREASFSGTLEQTSKLGLPELPKPGPGPSSADPGWMELLSGPHTARVYRDGAQNARIQVMDRLAERNVIRRGSDVWFYNSKDNTATHTVLPASTGDPHPKGQEPVTAPDVLAQELLAKLDPGTDVSVAADVQVAGRAAYQLVLTPKSSSTLLASVAISVDGQSGMPLGVELKARGESDPAFRVAFTKLSLQAPDAAVFQFSPPPGATVKELPAQDRKSEAGKDRPAVKDSKQKVSGTGWESVVELPAGALSMPPAQQPGQQSGGQQPAVPGNAAALLAQATVPVPGGRLLSTALVNVLILNDGRIFAGSVPLDRLQAAAAGR